LLKLFEILDENARGQVLKCTIGSGLRMHNYHGNGDRLVKERQISAMEAAVGRPSAPAAPV
jgi:hypothetical protein